MDQNIIGTTKETVFEKQTIKVRQLKVWFRERNYTHERNYTLYDFEKNVFVKLRQLIVLDYKNMNRY